MITRLCKRTTFHINLLKTNEKYYSRWEKSMIIDEDNDEIKVEIHNTKYDDNKIKNLNIKFNKETINIQNPLINNEKLLKIATTPIRSSDFKKLSFLGDAYLDFIISTLLLHQFPLIQKNQLVEMLQEIRMNKNYSIISKKFKMLNLENDILKYSSIHADAFEAYFGAISLESGITSHFNQNTRITTSNINNKDTWNGWVKTCKFMSCNIKYLENSDILFDSKKNSNYLDSNRIITQLRNNQWKDFIKLINSKQKDDYELKLQTERLIFLGNSVLKYFITKLYIDNLDISTKKLDLLRSSNLNSKKMKSLIDKMLKKPSYSMFYSVFKLKKNEKSSIANSNHIKLYLGYLVFTHFPIIFEAKNIQLFQLGWEKCEKFVHELFYDDIVKKQEKSQIRNKRKTLVDPLILHG